MKFVVALFLLCSLLYSDELERIESIVKDITELRVQYEECKKELTLQDKQHAQVEKIVVKTKHLKPLKNNQNLEKIKTILASKEAKIVELTRKKEELEKSIKNKNKILLLKQKEIKDLQLIQKSFKSQNNKKIVMVKEKCKKFKDSKIKNFKNKIIVAKKSKCVDSNPFPKLLLKEAYRKKLKPDTIKHEEVTLTIDNETARTIKALTYRLSKDSFIYDAINADVVDKWERSTSFTSSVRSQSWIKITGYFLDKKWKRATKELWVKAKNTIIRR